jgi:hypothetical protein
MQGGMKPLKRGVTMPSNSGSAGEREPLLRPPPRRVFSKGVFVRPSYFLPARKRRK